VRLKDEKPSKRFLDETWIPEIYKKLIVDLSNPFKPYGNVVQEPVASHDSILTNPTNYNELDYHDREMLKSGATIQEVLFWKALRKRNNQTLLEK